MKFPRTSKLLGLVALTIIASPLANAQDSNWYFGANMGKTKGKIDDQKINSTVLSTGLTVINKQDMDKDTGYKAFFGYQFNKFFSLEGGYFDLGRFGYWAETAPDGWLVGRVLVRGVNIDAVISIPFTEKFSMFGRVGANNANVQGTFVGTEAVHVLVSNTSKRETNIKYGGGLEYDFTPNFGMRAEVERYRINDTLGNKGDIDFASLGVIFRFGRSTPYHEPAPMAAAPEPVIIPPAPVVVEAPIPVVVPVPVGTQEYCTILDIQFNINADQIELEEKEKLAVIGRYMTKYPQTTVVIEGHTDNVGSDEHNMALSQKRAESVVKYLIDERKIAPSRLSAVGYGNTRPIADNATEEGKRENRRINAVIACVEDVEGLTVLPARMTMALEIEFDALKADVLPKYDGDLRKVANFLKANPSTNATVEGHTGKLQQTEKEAMTISQLRAQNVVNYLVTNFGIDRSRLTAEGFGRTRRYAYSTTAEGRQENRRVNIIITYPRRSKQ